MLTRRTACLALVAAGAASKSTFAQPPRTIDDFFREFTDEWIRINPNLATSLRYFTGAEQDVLERQLTPLTIASARQRLQLARKGLAELRKFDRAGMTDTQRISAEVMAWQLEMVAAEEPYWDYSFPLEQMNGWNVASVERFTVARPLAKPRDAENYVAALAQVSTRMEEAIAESRRLAAKNVIPPRFILEATIKQIQSFVDPSPGQNPFVTAFADKMAAAPAIPAAQREQLRAEAERVVGTQIYPAWKKAAATLQAQLPRSTNDAGLWRLKGGPEAYAFFLKRYTTTSLTAEQIVTGTVSFMGKSGNLATATVSGSLTNPSANDSMTASLNVGSIVEGGTALSTAIKSITMNLNNNPRALSAVGNVSAIGVNLGSIALTGKVEAYFEDQVLLTKVYNHSTSSLLFQLNDPQGNTFVFTLAQLRWSGNPTNPGIDQDSMLPLDYACERQPTDSYMIQIDALAT